MNDTERLNWLSNNAPICIWAGKTGAAHHFGDGKPLFILSSMNPDATECWEDLAETQSLREAIDYAVRQQSFPQYETP